MLDTLDFILPTCWKQGMEHWRVVPEGSIQPPQNVSQPESSLLGTIRISLLGGSLPQDPEEKKPINAKLLTQQLLADAEIDEETFEEIAGKLVENMNVSEFLKEVRETLKGKESYTDRLLEVLQLTQSDFANAMWETRVLNDTETVTYNNHDFEFKYSELCQLSPREGMIKAWFADSEGDAAKKNEHAAHFSFHLSRALWTVVYHAYENSRNLDTWMFIIAANLARWNYLSLMVVSATVAAVFMQSENEVTLWIEDKTGPLSKFTQPVATAAEEARKILNSNDAWLGKLSILLAGHAMVPHLSHAIPFLSLITFGGTVVTCLAIGDFIGADDPRRSVPLPDETPPEEE